MKLARIDSGTFHSVDTIADMNLCRTSVALLYSESCDWLMLEQIQQSFGLQVYLLSQ